MTNFLDWLVIQYNLFRLSAAFSPSVARRIKRRAVMALIGVLAVVSGLVCIASMARVAHG